MLSSLPKKIKIVEVGPRDGLQNEKTVLKTEDKIEFIAKLTEAGMVNIEATSFVRPEKIPQMGDANKLFELLVKRIPIDNYNFPCLVPNKIGLENAKKAGVREIAVFTATSDQFNMKNINASIDESFIRIEEVVKEALSYGMKVRGYVSTVFGCPYLGETSLLKMTEVTQRLFDLGAYEVSLGDTIGVGTPSQVLKVIDGLEKANIPLETVAMHFHDTRGMALANVLTSLELGITNFDCSAGGLGGCPYAKGAIGNLATEDLVYLCHSLGIETGIDLEKLMQASLFILDKLGRLSSSKFLIAKQGEKSGK
ncbi:MAG: hydroxymethylglutaryl-CoA lyase [Halobacteriovoraceae bacterium]|jgi:hydroxymethylglutaryl-CoA lyase|nr:hydroxymethylglutaryl-CoA lyase [Halobacteriovoraceae bacterium]MBT5093308.1 hydroxymethylglutaryl-CoA lyase [Halobacteriovoraceae bacterium]